MARILHLLIGTHKGGFIFTSDENRQSWSQSNPVHKGRDVNHMVTDTRNGNSYSGRILRNLCGHQHERTILQYQQRQPLGTPCPSPAPDIPLIHRHDLTHQHGK